jgi:exopolyphosphatase/pppGpp-phosphohydrolase
MRLAAWKPLLLVAFLLLCPARAAAQQSRLYAGIEIGGSGVKATVIESKPGGLYERLFSKTHRTKLTVLDKGAFRPEAIAETVKRIGELRDTIRKSYDLPDDHIIVVGSSGVPKASNRDALASAVKKATGKTLTFISDRTEVELTIAGVVPRGDRAGSWSLDIGSGNTKGGYQPENRPLVYVSVPLGVETFTQKVQQEAKDKGITFSEAAGLLRKTALVAPLKAGTKEMPELARRKRVYLSGGTVWALVSLVKPREVGRTYVTFTAADVDAYRALLVKAKGKAPTVDLSTIVNRDLRERAAKEIKTVNKVYSPENLLAGAEILEALVEAFNLKDRTLIFPRNAAVGWLAAYVAGEKRDLPKQ